LMAFVASGSRTIAALPARHHIDKMPSWKP
jgi:hypothetical protein